MSDSSITFAYDSEAGGLLRDGATCADVASGDSYATAIAGKKAVIINGGHTRYQTALRDYGISQLDYKPSTASYAEISGYDIIVGFSEWGSMHATKEAILKAAYDDGKKIITDGNDIGRGSRPSMIASSATLGAGTGDNIVYSKTGNTGLSPAFPYTFNLQAFNGDSYWQCITAVTAGTVIIADSLTSEATPRTCATAIASSNSAGGRWVHMTMFSGAGTQGSIFYSGLDWLVM